MRRLTVDTHPIGIKGVWRIRSGNAYLATLVQPILMVELGQRPSAEEIRDAVRDTAPGYGVTDQTPIIWADNTED